MPSSTLWPPQWDCQFCLPPICLFWLQGEPWLAVLQGHELDPAKQQADQQRLLLERFQREVRLKDC